MPLQLKRILLVFICFTLVFILLRSFLKADSFGQYGHYRGAALAANKIQDFKYVDQSVCADCHQDIVDLAASGLHDVVACQICHGPGYLHIDTTQYTEMKIIDTREYCGSCHEIHPAKREIAIYQVDLTEHNPDDDKCINCHNPHEPWLDL